MLKLSRLDSRGPALQKYSSLFRILDKLCALILVLCPILQHYRGFFMELSSELVILMAPYVFYRFVFRKNLRFAPVVPLAAYALYVSFIHGFSLFTFGREMLLVLYFVAALNGGISLKYILHYAKKIGIIGAWCLLVQYFCYYLLGFHLQLVPVRFLLDSAEQWIGLAQTGRISVTGSAMSFYRPSAFFLEPSHMALYAIPSLVMTLTAPKLNRSRLIEALWLSLGIVLSTSGMGIAMVAAVWGLYFLLYFGVPEGQKRQWKDFLQLRFVIPFASMLVLFLVMYFGVSFFRSAVNRIFVGSDGGNNAILGRMSTGIELLGLLSGWNVLFGNITFSIAKYNVPGFFYTTFQYGILGCLLHYSFFALNFFKLKRSQLLLNVLVVLLSLVTVHTFAAFFRMYFTFFLLSGYVGLYKNLPEKKRKNYGLFEKGRPAEEPEQNSDHP